MLGCESIAAYSHIYNTEHAIQTGKEIPLDARTYPASTSRLLYTEAASYRGKFPIDDQYASITKATSCAAWHGESKMYVQPTGNKDEILKPRQRMPANTTYMARISVAQKPRHTLKDNLLRLRMLLSRSPNYTQTTLPWAGKRTSCVCLPFRFLVQVIRLASSVG